MTTIEYGVIREIKEDLVLSPSLPRLAVRYDLMLVYLGDLQYIRRETFHVEEFILINPSGEGHVSQLLLVHFAGYLENKEGAYESPCDTPIELAGDKYQVETFFINMPDYIAQFKDAEITRAADYIRQRSYTMAGDMAFVRVRRIITEDLRNEFSVLYAEEIKDGQQPPAEDALIQRALKSFEIIK